jgi:hypothetical protein
MAHDKYTIEQVEEALKETLGAITLAAERLGASYNTVARYVAKSPTLQALISHYRERRIDNAELALEKAIGNGEPWAVALTLKTLGRNRGYVERVEQEVSGEIKTNLTPEQIAQKVAGLIALAQKRKNENDV